MLKYTKDHEWIRIEGTVGTVGITSFAQEKLGDLVFVELPRVGAKLEKGASVGTVESVKAAADVFAPVSGEVIEINQRAVDEPGVVNTAPTQDGWLFKVRIGNLAEAETLLDEAAYRKLIE